METARSDNLKHGFVDSISPAYQGF